MGYVTVTSRRATWTIGGTATPTFTSSIIGEGV